MGLGQHATYQHCQAEAREDLLIPLSIKHSVELVGQIPIPLETLLGLFGMQVGGRQSLSSKKV